MTVLEIPVTAEPSEVSDELHRLGIYGAAPELVRRVEDLGDAWAVTSVVLDERGRVRRIDGEVLTVTSRHPKERP